MHDHEGKIRAKVLGELLGHMMSLHGSPTPGAHSAALPHADGTPKHEKVEGIAVIGKHGGMGLSEESPTSEAAEHEPESAPDDLFGRKTGKKMAF